MKGGDAVSVCEIFGPTIQGEGALIGQPTVFVRTGGCDYRCSWCDSAFAVDKEFRHQWLKMSSAAILDQVKSLTGGKPLLVSLSGGNPALQPLEELILLGLATGYRFAMETQGSIARPWFSLLSMLTLSPKPPSSGMQTDWQKIAECLIAAKTAPVSLKLVVHDEEDYRFARRTAARFPQLPVYLQPCNSEISPEGKSPSLEPLHRLTARVLADAWYEARVLPQLHVLLWGNMRGR
jgi:7-carboxy-7-deazaguanine synthase